MNTMPGTNFHQAWREAMAITPTAIHIADTSTRNAGLDGRRPICMGLSGSNRRDRDGRASAPGLGVTRPVVRGLRRRLAMDTKTTGDHRAGTR